MVTTRVAAYFFSSCSPYILASPTKQKPGRCHLLLSNNKVSMCAPNMTSLIFDPFFRLFFSQLKCLVSLGYMRVFESLGMTCRCCDGAGGECRSSWDSTCTKLDCHPWKFSRFWYEKYASHVYIYVRSVIYASMLYKHHYFAYHFPECSSMMSINNNFMVYSIYPVRMTMVCLYLVYYSSVHLWSYCCFIPTKGKWTSLKEIRCCVNKNYVKGEEFLLVTSEILASALPSARRCTVSLIAKTWGRWPDSSVDHAKDDVWLSCQVLYCGFRKA